MTLQEFLTQKGYGSQSWLARKIGVYPSDVSDWVKGKAQVPPRHCKKIERATLGFVSVMELRPDDWQEFWSPPRKKKRKQEA